MVLFKTSIAINNILNPNELNIRFAYTQNSALTDALPICTVLAVPGFRPS